MVISVVGIALTGVLAVTNFKASAESGKFTFKSRSESGKLSTVGCHFPPKATNVGTLVGTQGGELS